MKVELYASQPHYRKHLLPIHQALPKAMRGEIHQLGYLGGTKDVNAVALVAGGVDAHMVRGHCKAAIYVEHGAGQSYGGDRNNLAAAQTPGYSLADGHRWPHVVGFIAPSQRVADRWTSAPSIAVGCPKMDRWKNRLSPAPTGSVCFVFHWDASQICPEAGTAWLHYAPRMKAISDHFRRQGYLVYGHAHPRWNGALDQSMRAAGLRLLEHEEQVFLLAGIMFVDNSSLGPEFSTLGRQVVWLNAPQFRRDVNHGGRFWEWTDLAPSVDDPVDLLDLELDHLRIESWGGEKQLAEGVYAYTDGSSSRRAAEFIASLVG